LVSFWTDHVYGFRREGTALKKGSKVFKYGRKLLDYTRSDFNRKMEDMPVTVAE
jgi:hypothetical protein